MTGMDWIALVSAPPFWLLLWRSSGGSRVRSALPPTFCPCASLSQTGRSNWEGKRGPSLLRLIRGMYVHVVPRFYWGFRPRCHTP
jgi:hypothetical protein